MYESELYREDVKNVASSLKGDSLKNSNILITGATGLIGSFLIDVLMYRNLVFEDNITIYANARNEENLKDRFRNYNIVSYDKRENKSLCYIAQDICKVINADIKFDFVIHGASNTHPIAYATDPIGTITTNFIGLYNILNYCITRIPKKIIFLSSVEIYGENNTDEEKFDEKSFGYIDTNTLRAGYPESKRLCESLCQAYISKYNYNISIARLCRIYGPSMKMDDSKALSQFIRNSLEDRDIVLKSNGEQYFSYCYVADAVSGILTILVDGKNGEAYNVADDASDIKLKDLAAIIANFNNRDVRFELPNDQEKKGFSKSTIAILDSTKLNELGWKAQYDIKTGINRTLKILSKK